MTKAKDYFRLTQAEATMVVHWFEHAKMHNRTNEIDQALLDAIMAWFRGEKA